MEPRPSLRQVDAASRLVVERLWQLYRHDLSEFRGSLPDGTGGFADHHLARVFDEPGGLGYLMYSGTSPVGFALVRGTLEEPRTVSEFFVVRAARRQRIGYRAAVLLLGLYPGRWEIAFQEENPGAAHFWRIVATAVAGETWSEERRPVPGKPEIPPDVWITLDTHNTVTA